MRGRCAPKQDTCYCVLVVPVFAPSAFTGAVLVCCVPSVFVFAFAALESAGVFFTALCFFVTCFEDVFTCDFAVVAEGALAVAALSSDAPVCTAVLAFRFAWPAGCVCAGCAD